MYYRLVTFNLGEEKLNDAKIIFSDLKPIISAQPGCKAVTCFGDAKSGKYGFSVLWNTEEDSESAKTIIGPLLSRHLADNNASDKPFSSELFEVIN
jgi:hypothetical protein